LGNCSGRFMEARTEGNTPWPEYTNAIIPKTSGIVAQLPTDVTAPAGNPPARHTKHERCSTVFVNSCLRGVSCLIHAPCHSPSACASQSLSSGRATTLVTHSPWKGTCHGPVHACRLFLVFPAVLSLLKSLCTSARACFRNNRACCSACCTDRASVPA
jgi:hypothetical protein